ncbi:MAG: hypothetical protein HUJ31_17540 [Pseudomonadales bacterium]|nr:hypothetical protein [Pseudomonadales bacterium]
MARCVEQEHVLPDHEGTGRYLMLLVKQPDRSALLDVLKGLRESRYEREEVAAWQQAVDAECGGEIPLSVEDGHWYFRSLSLLTVPVSLGDGEPWFIRDQDIDEYILDIEKVPATEHCGEVRRIRSHQMDRTSVRWPLIMFEDDVARSPEAMGLPAVRGVFEEREDPVEHLHLMFRDALYLIVRQYDENIDQLMVLGTSRDEAMLRAFLGELDLVP